MFLLRVATLFLTKFDPDQCDPDQCGFRKGFNAQHCLLTMVEKLRKTLDEGGETGAVLTDLSKAFDCIDHNLLIAKLNAYRFEKRSLGFIHSYLTKCKQRTKVDSAFSSWEMLLSGVPQGSILGPLLFNIYVCDVFFETPENIDFAGYADDNTPYTYSSKIEHVLTNLQSTSEKLFSWFFANHLVVLIYLLISVLPILRSQMWEELNCSECILKVDLILIIT